MKFITETGSQYEINTEAKQIRRLSGTANPTARQGKDGEWKTYDSLSPIQVGEQVVIFWGGNAEPMQETIDAMAETGGLILTTTQTSRVAQIIDEGKEGKS